MLQRISFFVPGIARTQGSHKAFPYRKKSGKTGVVVVHDAGKELATWRESVSWHARRHTVEMFDPSVALQLCCLFALRRPLSHFTRSGTLSSKGRECQTPIFKPDLDKLVRAIADALSGIVYHDDSRIVAMYCRKSWSNEPGVDIVVSDASESIVPLTRAHHEDAHS